MKESQTYSAFAEIYDRVMRDVDYDSWAMHIINLAQQYGIEVNKILDIACGTGSFVVRLARQGYEVSGIDYSQPMIDLAKKKLREDELKVPIYQASMDSFSHLKVERDYDLITCLYDSLNYILKEKEVMQCFAEVYNHLRSGGAFIFDVTTEYNLLHNFAGYVFAENFEDASYIWENEYDIVRKICKSKVTMFMKEQKQFNRYIEVHVQRVYSNADIREMLENEGFQILGMFHNLTENPPQNQSERIHFVCQKP